MISKIFKKFSKYKVWLGVIIAFNLLFGIFLWLVDSHSFPYIFPSLVLGSVLLYSFTGAIVYARDKRKMTGVLSFIENPDFHEEEICVNLLQAEEKEVIHLMGEKLREKDSLIKQQELNLKEYKEYIETWAHEIKTPLALMTFVLDNRKVELPLPIYERLEYSRAKMQEDIERILYYARVKSEHIDYIFTVVDLKEICNEVIEEYKGLLEEQKININNEAENIQVISDKKGLSFVLRQLLSNSIKYKNKEEVNPTIKITTKLHKKDNYISLTINDNGIGVNDHDLPFLFDKGFTGDAGQYRKQSTGMGLYLSKEIADDLKIEMSVSEGHKRGFEITLRFPIVEE